MDEIEDLPASPPTAAAKQQAVNDVAKIDVPSSDEEYEDAVNDYVDKVDLHEAFKDCEIAIKKFFSNDVHGALVLMRSKSEISLYHSLGAAIFAFIPAILTYDSSQISNALKAIKKCIALCNESKKHFTIVEALGSIIKKPNYALHSDEEAHAELCYAEALLLQAALTIIEGEDLAGFIKGTFKVKACHSSYKQCLEMLELKEWESEESRVHFSSGVRLGTATFNLMISMLPPKILTLLEFAGFSGHRAYGLKELELGSKSPGLRRVLCDLTLLAYHLVLQAVVGGVGDYEVSKAILQNALKEYPNSAWFLIFLARYQLLQGNVEQAITIYNDTSVVGQEGFREFRHLCYWELMWIKALMLDFRASSDYAKHLMEQSAWSKTTYSYVRAVMLLGLGNESNHNDHVEIRQLMRDAASYKIRIAGKSLPMEKFVIRRCARYHLQQEKLILPAIELLCIWNLLPIMKKNGVILHKYLKKIEETREVAMCGLKDWMCGHEADNSALLHYMEGCVLTAMGLPYNALKHFQDVIALKKDIKEDTFLVPYAVTEMAMCYYHLEEYERAMELLTEARRKYSGYALESRLQFRIHARIQMTRKILGNYEGARYISTAGPSKITPDNM